MDQPTGRAALAGALASLAFTGNAVRPVARRGWLSLPAFLAAWPVSELPLQTLATQAASAVALSARPGHRPRGPRAKVAASATALSWIGLVALDRAARRSDRTLAEAIRESAVRAPRRTVEGHQADPRQSGGRRCDLRPRSAGAVTGARAESDGGRRLRGQSLQRQLADRPRGEERRERQPSAPGDRPDGVTGEGEACQRAGERGAAGRLIHAGTLS